MRVLGRKVSSNGVSAMPIYDKNSLKIFSRASSGSWVKVFRINPEFRILRLTFHRKSASKH